jgi:hypothetical protein
VDPTRPRETTHGSVTDPPPTPRTREYLSFRFLPKLSRYVHIPPPIARYPCGSSFVWVCGRPFVARVAQRAPLRASHGGPPGRPLSRLSDRLYPIVSKQLFTYRARLCGTRRLLSVHHTGGARWCLEPTACRFGHNLRTRSSLDDLVQYLPTTSKRTCIINRKPPWREHGRWRPRRTVSKHHQPSSLAFLDCRSRPLFNQC